MEQGTSINAEHYRELMTLLQSNQSAIRETQAIVQAAMSQQEEQGKKVDRIYNTVIGNGSQTSIVVRLTLVEERQQKAATERAAMASEMRKFRECLDEVKRQSASEGSVVDSIKKKQDSMSDTQEDMAADLSSMQKLMAALQNKAIGIGIGAGLGSTGLIVLLNKLFGG